MELFSSAFEEQRWSAIFDMSEVLLQNFGIEFRLIYLRINKLKCLAYPVVQSSKAAINK